DRIEGRRVQLTNPDKSKTFASIYMHENRVYITEATVPGNAPPPALFNQSMGFLDKDGVRVRYESIYSNAYPAPKRIPGGPNRPMGCDGKPARPFAITSHGDTEVRRENLNLRVLRDSVVR